MTDYKDTASEQPPRSSVPFPKQVRIPLSGGIDNDVDPLAGLEPSSDGQAAEPLEVPLHEQFSRCLNQKEQDGRIAPVVPKPSK